MTEYFRAFEDTEETIVFVILQVVNTRCYPGCPALSCPCSSQPCLCFFYHKSRLIDSYCLGCDMFEFWTHQERKLHCIVIFNLRMNPRLAEERIWRVFCSSSLKIKDWWGFCVIFPSMICIKRIHKYKCIGSLTSSQDRKAAIVSRVNRLSTDLCHL